MNQEKHLKENYETSSEDEVNVNEELVLIDNGEEINVEFEGFPLSDDDFEGIKRFLLQQFADASIDVNQFANTLIIQNFIGTVLKQSETPDDEIGDDSTDVFAFVTCYSLSGPKDDLRNSLVSFLLNKSKMSKAKAAIKEKFKNVLTKCDNNCQPFSESVGLLISERYVSVPPQAVVPMYDSLMGEITEAQSRNHKSRYDFSYFILICKICDGFQSRQQNNSSDGFYVNAEEEFFTEEADSSFDYSVPADTNIPTRRVLLISKNGFRKALDKLKDRL